MSKLQGDMGRCANCYKEAYISAHELKYICSVCKKDAMNNHESFSFSTVVHMCTKHLNVYIVCCLCRDIHEKTHEGKRSCPCGIIIEENMRSYLCGCTRGCNLKYCSLGCKTFTEKKKECNIMCCSSTFGKHCYKKYLQN